MRKLTFPDTLDTVKSLYESVYTVVIINGVISTPFKVTRGVRQGDPMLCLLFDLAIEPLAAMLRNSNLIGFKIPGAATRLITTLFANDTTVFLSMVNKFEDVQSILERWCKASGAKFNVPKTEVIRIGSEEYRKSVLETRKLNVEHEAISNNIHIAKDGEPTRTLGAWIGNKVNNATPWTLSLRRLNMILNNGGKATQL